ncbi:AraC family transcriptional regulator [Spirosoma sp. KNUC1025]|uniref:helix-turn-helix domain-containing protein n=1 Tax=Spirosoma sp. KNUC1025 TaxID=2894082 RepID=UPI003866016A|nr:helix-turn-helix domain-containing protein [Spirosoma sp. KNUC1025]
MTISTRRVSQIINQGFGMNFNDFVNLYRIKAVIAQIQSGNHTMYTLLGIAYECGFNSKSTFNRAFKKRTGLAPRDYLAQNRPK